MSAPGAGGERLLFPICDSAPRGTGDPRKSALGAGRRGIHSTHGANDGSVFVMTAVVVSPSAVTAELQPCLRSRACQIVHMDWLAARAAPECAASVERGRGKAETKAPTDDIRVVDVPGVVADSAPRAGVKDLDAP